MALKSSSDMPPKITKEINTLCTLNKIYRLIRYQLLSLRHYVSELSYTTYGLHTLSQLTGFWAMNCCSGISPSVRSIFCLLANGSSPIIIGGGKLPVEGMTGGAALNGIGSSPGVVILPPLGCWRVAVMLEGGGTGGAEEMCPGVPNSGVDIEGGFGGAIISAGELA